MDFDQCLLCISSLGLDAPLTLVSHPFVSCVYSLRVKFMERCSRVCSPGVVFMVCVPVYILLGLCPFRVCSPGVVSVPGVFSRGCVHGMASPLGILVHAPRAAED